MTWIEVKGDYWQPDEPGDYLEGVIIDINPTEYGDVYVLDCKINGMIATPAHKVLQSRLSKFVVGKRVRIEFRGTRPTKKGNPVNIYKVFSWAD